MSTCNGCGQTLLENNAWMEDGCPCNSPKGCNNGNQHISEWRSELLQAERQSHAATKARLDEAQKKADDELNNWLRLVRKAAGLEAYIVPATGLLDELRGLRADLDEARVKAADADNHFIREVEISTDLRRQLDEARASVEALRAKLAGYEADRAMRMAWAKDALENNTGTCKTPREPIPYTPTSSVTEAGSE